MATSRLAAAGSTQGGLESAGVERAFCTGAAAMVNGDTIFTITGGPIQIVSLHSECITTHQAVATTAQYQSVPTVGSATTISGATTTLSGVAAGTTFRLAPTALSTAPVISLAAAGGVQLGTNVANFVNVNAGTIKLVIGTGGTGTWKHFLRYKPLCPDVQVS